jgi:hypothetical protein
VTTVVNQLFAEYRVEGLTMPYTMEDFRREVAREHLHEILKRLSPEERLAGLPPEQIEAYLRRLEKKPPVTTRKKRKRRAEGG